MAKRALYQVTERILAVATDILHIGNSNKDYRISFANLCQYIWMYLTGTYFIEQAVKNISAGNQVTNLSIYEAGGASEKPNGFRIKVSWAGGLDAGTYNHLFTGTTYTIGGVSLATDNRVGVGTGYWILQLDKVNGDWKIIEDGTELIYAMYTNSTGVPADTIINFQTKVIDKYNTVTVGPSWKFTSPKSSLYTLTEDIVATAGGALRLYKGGNALYYGGHINGGGQFGNSSWTVYLAKNEYIDFRFSSAVTASSSAWCSIIEKRN